MNKVKTLEEIMEVVTVLKKSKKKIIWTNGCFDLLHVGHIRYLNKAKTYGDVLILGLNTDDSIRRLKGEGRPIIPEEDRAEVLSSLQCINYIVFFNEDNPLRLLRMIKPDVKIKGGSYVPERVKEEDAIIKSYGGESIYLPLYGNFSTSTIIRRIVDNYNNGAK